MPDPVGFLVVDCEGFVEALDIEVHDSPDDPAPATIRIIGECGGLPPCMRILRRVGIYPAGAMALDIVRHGGYVTPDRVREVTKQHNSRRRTAVYTEVRRQPIEVET